jgi:hypothetical protein
VKKAWLILLVAAPGWAAAPKVVFQETVHDFGTVVQGATVRHSFPFRNAGNADLEITSVTTSCGCTAALASDRVLRPSKTGRVNVTFDSTGRPGVTDKKVRVWTNDPAEPLVVLTVQGQVLSGPGEDPALLAPAKGCVDSEPCADAPADLKKK